MLPSKSSRFLKEKLTGGASIASLVDTPVFFM
jgi:hypothetical protein